MYDLYVLIVLMQSDTKSIDPQLHLSVLSSRCHQPSIDVPVQRIHLVGVAREVHHQLPGLEVPQLQRGVLAAGDDVPAVDGPAEQVDGADVAVEVAHELACVPVPQLHLLVETPRGDVASIWGEEHVVDGLAVAHHLLHRHLVRQLEQLQGEVVRSRHQPLPVLLSCLLVELQSAFLLAFALEALSWFVCAPAEDVLGGEGHGVDPVAVFLMLAQEVATAVEAADALVLRPSEDLIPAAPQHLRHAFRVVPEGTLATAVEGVPQSDRAVFGGGDEAVAFLGEVLRDPCQGGHPLVVAVELHLLLTVRVVDRDVAVLFRIGELLPVGSPLHDHHPIIRLHLLRGSLREDVPQSQCAIT